MRWKALAFFKPFANKNKETFGLKSTNSPKTVDQMKAFEDDLVKMAQNIEFRKVDNAFQKNLSKICKELQNEPKLIIPADKTSNFYKISKDQYEELRIKDVQKCYRKEKMSSFDKINREHKKIAQKLDISDRIFQTSQQDCFVTIKDHKQNFREKPEVRTINPAKPELGRVAKKMLENKIETI